MNRTNLLCIFAGLAIANFSCSFMFEYGWKEAFERTIFQSVPLVIVAFYTKKP